MKISVSILLAVVLLGCPAQAIEAPPAAKERARFYQRETMNVLVRYGWHISHDNPGKIVADHPVGFVEDVGGVGRRVGLLSTDTREPHLYTLAWLTLVFRPETVKRTDCIAGIVAYEYSRIHSNVAKSLFGPFPYNSSDSTKEIKQMLREAEGRMETAHPEYSAH